ncbi:NAD(P)-dependent dehydrogenase (short-subunit alcohol dehydrogenase family) [Trinickia symbiotica]|uniref:SDR family oxidoreductase n=1 Tax=Trinickia symbiotica TaxID=863227 RepID=A0A2N7WL18_9BURK|nr:SDR family oxidoreductase [Trinickia symbiotica]PMS30110.1 SDR family oxidoreductase [Trinickia symbiotica]PPK41106.1 NAD(P)-dependent dehydrogenase (short-subunit alcohol dehydrogenase family) [Trinickia symbiotica]
MRLKGKMAFVTGAAGGIGSAICKRFLAEGALVAAADISAERAAANLAAAIQQGHALAIECDVGDGDSVRAAIARAAEAFGGINVLCNVAGGSSPHDNFVTEVADDEFWRTIRVDLYGTFVCCKHGLPELVKAGGGSVINMTSMMALMGAPGLDCYTAAKGGVAALTRAMAIGYGKHAIRVNAIAPGITITPRVQAFLDGGGGGPFVARHVLGLGEPVDVAHMAVYLASDESRVVTGQVLAVDSGVTVG